MRFTANGFNPRYKQVSLINSDTLQIEYGTDLINCIDEISVAKEFFLKNGTPLKIRKEEFARNEFGQHYCYFSHAEDIVFTLPKRLANSVSHKIFLACEMSGWERANKNEKWALRELLVEGERMLGIAIDKKFLFEPLQFKFVDSENKWYSPDNNTPNRKTSAIGTLNFLFSPKITGCNIVNYKIEEKLSFNNKVIVKFSDNTSIVADPEPWISSLYSDIELGVTTFDNSAIFRIFAPRATAVRVSILSKINSNPAYYKLVPTDNGIWSTEIFGSLHKKYYYYQMLFSENEEWEKAPHILDPYAKATVSSKGPGIILHEKVFSKEKDSFTPPIAPDLVIVETHLRDIITKAPTSLTQEDRLGFSGLKKCLHEKHFYLRRLNVNCVELQPIQEFDYKNKSEYHWGYMPANWFSPASAYSNSPAQGDQVNSLKNLVKSFHKAGMAVILDVVYNHFGHSGHLSNIDPKYYFRHDQEGKLLNFSGCGNDIKTENPMVRKLIIDSLEHLIKTYNIDGFRFDLAELLGIDFLEILQKRLKTINPSIILIAEPWSFRGHIGVEMRELSYSVWNDDYREFIKKYVLGTGNSEGLRYFLCGCLDFKSRFPCQSVNYVASHDDRGWVDNITENPHNNGSAPTDNDRRRTHLSAAILMTSIGIPMISAGQDFMFSKYGANNTYNRGDLNALDYRLLAKQHQTHDYFCKLIKLRLSKLGQVFRLTDVPDKTYFRFFASPTSSACALIYNDNKMLNLPKIMFAINPHTHESEINLKDFDLSNYRCLANEENVFLFPKKNSEKIVNNNLVLPPLSCRIFSLQ